MIHECVDLWQGYFKLILEMRARRSQSLKYIFYSLSQHIFTGILAAKRRVGIARNIEPED